METYILRIYRRGQGIPHRLVGIVEESGVEGKKAFTCVDDLWRILNPTQARQALSEQNKESRGHKKRKPLRKAKVSMQERPGARR